MASPSRPIRLVVQQPALPRYRLPVFAELGRRAGIQLRVIYSRLPDISNVDPVGFQGRYVPGRLQTIFGHPIFWHRPQRTSADPKQADVLVLSWNLRYVTLIPALLRARRRGVGVVLWGHGYSKFDAPWRSWPRRKAAQLATALLFYDHTAAERYIKQGFDRQKIFVALNALDQTPIQQARRHWLDRPEDLAHFRREQKLESGPVVLFVSRLVRQRRIELLMQAMAQLSNAYPHMQLVLIGKGEHEPALKAFARSRGLDQRVRFVGAIYDEMALAPWFLSAECFAFPAFLGLSLLHAFGYGLPVVAGDDLIGHGPEIEALHDGRNGLLHRNGDAADLAAKLRTLFENPQRRQKMAAEALRTVTEQFTLKNMVDGFEAAVRYTFENRGGGGKRPSA